MPNIQLSFRSVRAVSTDFIKHDLQIDADDTPMRARAESCDFESGDVGVFAAVSKVSPPDLSRQLCFVSYLGGTDESREKQRRGLG